MNKEYVIGLIADTHANFTGGKLVIAASLIQELEKCDFIIHLGDIGNEGILQELGLKAPIFAVAGNCECGDEKLCALPKTLYFNIFGHRIIATHIILSGGKNRFRQEMKDEYLDRFCDIFFPNSDVILFAHTHEPIIMRTSRRLYVNSGAINRPTLKPSIVKLTISPKEVTAKIVWDESYRGETLKE